MKRALQLAATLFVIGFGCLALQPSLRGQPVLMPLIQGTAGGGGTNNMLLDCGGSEPTSCPNNGGSSFTATLSTTAASGLVVAYGLNNGSSLSSVSDTKGLTYSIYKNYNPSGANWLYVATASFSSALSSDIITATMSGSTGGFVSTGAFAITGSSGSFDAGSGGSFPVTATTDPVSITTANAIDFVMCFFRASAGTPTAGTGWTLIGSPSGSFLAAEYQKVTSTGTFSCSLGTGSGGSGVIGTAIHQ